MIDNSSLAQYTKEMRIIEENILNFLDEEEPQENDHEKINELIKNIKDKYNQQDSREILYLLMEIAKYHHQTPGFIDKIWILIKQNIQNINDSEIFNIFKYHKLIILYLFQNKIIKPTRQILDVINSVNYQYEKYDYYFFPEFRHFFEKDGQDYLHTIRMEFFNSEEFFEVKRKNGQNDSYICQLIRNDSIKDFIIYVNKNNINHSSIIADSIFETNPFLLRRKPTLLEYSAFYGSIQIFQYLMLNNANITPELNLYAICGNNPNIIHLLEEIKIDFINELCLVVAIKCHHHDIANYIKNQLQDENKESIMNTCLLCHNFIELFDMIETDGFNSFNQLEIFEFFIVYNYRVLTNYFYNEIINKNDIYYEKAEYIINYVVRKGDIETFKLLIGDIDVNKKMYERKTKTLFHIAVEYGNVDIVKLMLKPPINADVNEVIFCNGIDIYGFTDYKNGIGERNSLHIAIQNKDIEMLKVLLKSEKIDVNAKFVKEIIKKRNVFETQELTPLYMAVKTQNYEIVHLLLSKKGIDVNKRSLDTIYYNRDVQYLNMKIGPEKRRKMMKEDERYYYRKRCHKDEKYTEEYYRDEETTRMYRCGGAKTPLHAAIQLQNIPIIKLLLSHRKIDVNARSICYCLYKSVVTPLYEAFFLNNEEIQTILKSNEKIDINKKSDFYEEEERYKFEVKRFYKLKFQRISYETHYLSNYDSE